MRKTNSGSRVMSNTLGINPMNKPQITKKIGYEIRNFSLNIEKRETTINRTMMSSKLFSSISKNQQSKDTSVNSLVVGQLESFDL